MAALKNYLPIECYCTENQMKRILSTVTRHIYDFGTDDIQDFDDTVGDTRIYVEFDRFMNTLQAKTAEVLDADWVILEEDSAVFSSRLRKIISEYNLNETEALHRALSIASEYTH